MLISLLLTGCAEPAPTEAALDAERGGQQGYYTLQADLRDCAYPMCGGWFIKAVNRRETVCPDGTRADSCYVAEVDTAILATRDQQAAWDDAIAAGSLLVRGTPYLVDINGVDYGAIQAIEAWGGLTGSPPSGLFERITENGLVCFADPCAHLDENKLNGNSFTAIGDLDWRPSGADPTQIADGLAQTNRPGGLIVAGKRYTVSGTAGTLPGRRVTEAWVPFAP